MSEPVTAIRSHAVHSAVDPGLFLTTLFSCIRFSPAANPLQMTDLLRFEAFFAVGEGYRDLKGSGGASAQLRIHSPVFRVVEFVRWRVGYLVHGYLANRGGHSVMWCVAI